MDRTILHCDLNNFFASVEERNNPELKGHPIAVSGNPELRHGIVLAKNNLAKAMGVKTAEPIWMAKEKCPDIIFVPPHYDEYEKYSNLVFKLYTEYTDRVEPFGIDECWLDVTESLRLFGSGKEIADKLRYEVKERFNLTISVGVSFTKVLAKLGSDYKKPDATTVFTRDNYMDLIGNMSPSEMIMVGNKTCEKLKDLNINTIKDLANASDTLMYNKFGVIAETLLNAARGIETEEVKLYYDFHLPKSVSNGTTTPKNIETLDEAKMVIYSLSENIAYRLRKYNLVCNGISLQIKNPNLKVTNKQCGIPYPSSSAQDIAEAATNLLSSIHSFKEPLRAITIGAIRLTSKDNMQLNIFNTNETSENLDKAVDEIRDKFGYSSLKRGILIKDDFETGLKENTTDKTFQ